MHIYMYIYIYVSGNILIEQRVVAYCSGEVILCAVPNFRVLL